jgi:hypothetical protein
MTQRHAQRGRRLATAPVPFNAEDREFTDLQHAMLAAEQHLRDNGLPHGQP